MSDLFSFQSNDINAKKFGTNKEVDPLLFSNSDNPQIYFLVEHVLSAKTLLDFKMYLKGNFPGLTYSIISSLPFKPTEKDLKKSVTELYGFNCINLSKYIPDWSKVVPIGRALYAITKGDDLCIEGFYDTIQWKTSFYTPEIKSRIFPIPYFASWLGLDTFENFFTLKQIKIAIEYNLQKQRLRKADLIWVDDPNEFLNKWKNYNGITGWDLETKYLDPWNPESRIICLTVAFECELNEYRSYFIPFKDIDFNLLNEFFSTKKLVGNNLKYDTKWQRVKHGIKRESLNIFWDNMKGSHAINELQYNSLKSDAWIYSIFGGYDLELEKYKIKYPKCKEDYSLIPKEILFPYATMDALVSLICYFAQQKEIDELDKSCPNTTSWTIRKCLEDISMPAINMFTDIEINGMFYDWNKLDNLSKDFAKKLQEKRIEVEKILNVPENINIDSGPQLGKFLQSKGWENPGLSKSGDYLTGEDSMSYWKKKGRKEVDLINEYTSMKSLFKTYIGDKELNSGYYQYRKSDDKIHGNFSVQMAESHRNKSYDPNLQNLPSHGELVVLVRANFSCPEDYYISENDAAGLQLRIGATMSGDKQMFDIFTKLSGDMHSVTAQSVFKQDISLEEFLKRKKETEIKEIRFTAKACFYEDSLVLTNKGFLYFKDIINLNGKNLYNDILKIIGEDGKQKEIFATYKGKHTDTIKFTMENGDILNVTPDHEMIILRNGIKQKIEAKYVINTDELINI